MSERVKHKGMPGHFIGASDCCWHLHTIVDRRWRISSVGCWHSGLRANEWADDSNRKEIGHGRLYETMVFDLASENTLQEIELVGYNDEEEADRGHFEIVNRWLKKVEDDER